MNAIDKVLPVLSGVKPVGGGQWKACCPAHDDQRESLSVSECEDGKVLIHCHAGCSIDDVVTSLKLTKSDLFMRNIPDKILLSKHTLKQQSNIDLTLTSDMLLDSAIKITGKNIEGTVAGRWQYSNANGSTAFWVVRFDTSNGKEFRPFVPHGVKGWHEGGLPKNGRPLYQLPDLKNARRVYVTEGEKACEAIRSLGLVATTSANGSASPSKTDWTPLTGKEEIIILPDNDESGKKYANTITDILAQLSPVPLIKVLQLPGLPPKGDAVEFIKALNGLPHEVIRLKIERLAENVSPIDLNTYRCGPVLVSLADVTPEPVEWLWPGRIAIGKLNLIAGDPGLGKSFLTLDMAARVTTGAPWPDSPATPNEPGAVILLSVEDDLADTVRPRLDAACADVKRIKALQGVTRTDATTGKIIESLFNLETDVPRLEEAIKQTPGVRLIIIDPISAFTGSTDSHKNAEIRGLLAPLSALAAKYKVAVVAITHLNKAAGGSVMYRSIGSIAFNATARAVWVIVKDRDNAARRLMLPVKNNLAVDGHGLAYSLIDSPVAGVPRIAWDSVPVNITADEAMMPPEGTPGPDPEDRKTAETWLKLALAGGPRAAKDAEEEAREAQGISKRTLERARKELGVIAYRPENPGPWFWRLPRLKN